MSKPFKLIFLSITLTILFTSFLLMQGKKKVIFFGDSITQAAIKPGGYIDLMNKMLISKGLDKDYELEGAGVSGNKIYDLYLRMEEDVLMKKPDIVIIYIGVNDVWHKQTSGTGTDADKFQKFYLAIIKKLKKDNIKIAICTPAVIGEKTDYSNQLDGDLNKYSNIIRSIAKNENLQLIDLRASFLQYNISNNTENKELGVLTSDRVHLNEAGNKLVNDEMWKVISEIK
jgi:lysophospholipase L1-like esterase